MIPTRRAAMRSLGGSSWPWREDCSFVGLHISAGSKPGKPNHCGVQNALIQDASVEYSFNRFAPASLEME
jgi:hypothetical protein